MGQVLRLDHAAEHEISRSLEDPGEDELARCRALVTHGPKRVRNNPDVLLAPCTARGTVTGPAVRARAAIIPAESRPEIWSRFVAKYGLQLRAIIWAERALRTLRRNPGSQGERIYLELTVLPT